MPGEDNGRILCVSVTPCLQRTIRFESLLLGEVNRALSVTTSSGGKSNNVARALRALQGSPLVAGLSGGETGSTMVSFLRDSGVETDMVGTSQPTRVCTTLIDEATTCVTELVEEAPLPTPDEWAKLDARLSLLIPKCPLMVLAGAPPPGSPSNVYARFTRRAQEAGASVLLDARGEVLTRALPFSPLLAKMNDRELVATRGSSIGTEETLLEAARTLIAQGAKWLLVTRGKQDAWLLNKTAFWRFTPPAIEAVNAVGSGDATTAGIAAGLLRGQSMPKAVRLGIACGSASAARLTPGDLGADLVERLIPEVRATRVTGFRVTPLCQERG